MVVLMEVVYQGHQMAVAYWTIDKVEDQMMQLHKAKQIHAI